MSIEWGQRRRNAVINICKIIAARFALACLAASMLAAAISYIPKPTAKTVTAEPETIMQPKATAKVRPAQEKPVLEPPEMTEADRAQLLQIMMAEAESESTATKAMVGLAVIHRRESTDFPNTIYEVLTQENQFTPLLDGRYYRVTPDEDCYTALELIKSGWDPFLQIMWYESCAVPSEWHMENLTYLFQLGEMRFYGPQK